MKKITFKDFKLDDNVINNSSFTQFIYEKSDFKIILKYTAPFAHWNSHCWTLIFYSIINNVIFRTEFETYSSEKESPNKVINMLNDNFNNILNICNNVDKNEKDNN